jgi:hypothetical protein
MESTRKEEEVYEMGKKLIDYFTDPEIEQIARETKFVQRRSRMTGMQYVKTLVTGYLEKPTGTLNHLAQVSEDLDLSISVQGIDERINKYSVDFLRKMLTKAIQWFQQQSPLILPILKQFQAILIIDSTYFELPTAMQVEFPGAGGSGSPASLKIQLVFDFLAGQFQQIHIGPGKNADQAYRGYLGLVKPGSLIIADLGYFCLDAFRAISDAQAYFLSRYHYPTALLSLTLQRINLIQWLRNQSEDRVEIPVLLGSRMRHRLPCRLIAVRVSENTAQSNRKEAIRNARRHKKILTPDYLETFAWSLHVTNVSQQLLSLDQVALFYHIRWQIELLFKLWKSCLGLSVIGRWRNDRILTELYAKLICCVLFQFLLIPERIPDEEWADRELSYFMSCPIISRYALRLVRSLDDLDDCCSVLSIIIKRLLRFGLKQKRKKNPNLLYRLAYA